MEFNHSGQLSGDIQVIQSKENEVFYSYLNFIKDKRTERAPFDAVLRDSSATEAAVAEAKAGIAKLTEEVNEYQYHLTNDLELLVCHQHDQQPQVPEAPENVEDAAMWQYLWYPATTGTEWISTTRDCPRRGFDQLVTRYWSKVLPQIPDTTIVEVYALLDRVLQAGNKDMFKYMVHHMTYASESLKIVHGQGVCGSVNSYYCTGMVDGSTTSS